MAITVIVLALLISLFIWWTAVVAAVFSAWAFLFLHPMLALSYALGYLCFGFAWSLVKWSALFREAARLKRDHSRWGGGFETTYQSAKDYVPLWITLWPLNVIYTCLDDYLERLGRWIFERFSSIYRVVATEMWKRHGPRQDD